MSVANTVVEMLPAIGQRVVVRCESLRGPDRKNRERI